MNGAQPTNVSVIDPINPAIERVKTVLFSPFDLMKWLTIGFCAWLAQLGHANGGGGGGNGAQYRGGRGDIGRHVDDAREYVVNNLDWIVPVGVVVAGIVVGLWLLLLWLSSRGRFMFLDCVVRNKAEVTDPWHRFRHHANSLFAFRAILGLITLAAAILPFLIGGIVVAASSATLGFNALSVLGIVAAVMYFVAVMVVAAVIGKFTKDFVVPIMYLHTNSSVKAWQMLLDLLSPNKVRFFLYILLQIAIAIVITTTADDGRVLHVLHRGVPVRPALRRDGDPAAGARLQPVLQPLLPGSVRPRVRCVCAPPRRNQFVVRRKGIVARASCP